MRPRSRLDAVTGVVGDAAGALRRRREGRRPYAKLYDGTGEVRLVDPSSNLGERLIETASEMVEAAAPTPSGNRSDASRPARQDG